MEQLGTFGGFMKTMVLLLVIKSNMSGTWVITTQEICEHIKTKEQDPVLCINLEDKKTFKF